MILNKHSVNNYQLVELLITANSANTKYFFPEQNLLRGKIIDKIEYYPDNAANPAPSGNAAGLTVQTAFLTLVDESGDEFVQGMPIAEIIGIFTGFLNRTESANGPFTMFPRKVIWPKSYISYPVANPLPTNYSVLFGVYYK